MMIFKSIKFRVASLFIAILLIVAGLLLLRKAELVTGLILTLLGAVTFILSVFLNEKYPLSEEERLSVQPIVLPIALWSCAFLVQLLIINAMSVWERSGATDRWIAAGWILSMLLAAAGVLVAVKWKPSLTRLKEFSKTHKKELFLVTGLLVLGAFFRIYDISDHPFPWSGDEASVGVEATRIIDGEVTDFYAAGWSGQPNWSFVPTVLSVLIFGRTFFAIRLVSAIDGILAVLGVYLLARELFGKRLAALAAGFLVAFPYHLQFSRIGVNNIVDSMTVCFVLWMTLRAIRKGKLELYLWAGLASGLCLYTYVGSRLVSALAVLALLYAIIRQRSFLREHILHLAVFFVSLCLAVSPLAYYFIRHPDIFMTRLGQESIFINNWLIIHSERSGQTIPSLLWKQFTDTVLVYISQNATGNFFNYPKPYLSIVGSIFFLFGMGMAVLKIRETRMFMLLAWFWSVVIIGGVLTLSPPANTRLVMTGPAVAIFLALGITTFLDLIQKLKLVPARVAIYLGAAIVLLLGMFNLATYFGVYRYQNYFEDATGEYTQVFGLELQSLGPVYDYYFLGLPRIFAAFPTVVFLAPDNNMYDITAESIDAIVLDPEKSQIFTAIPENRLDLERIADRFPGGSWEEVYRRYKPEVLYYAYILP